MRKLILFLLFLVFTVLAIGFIALPSFTMATNIKQINADTSAEDAGVIAGALLSPDLESATVIELPIVNKFMPAFAQIAVIQVGGETPAGYLCIIAQDNALSEATATNYIHGSSVIMWLFTLILIILLPKKMSKKKVRRIAEDVVEDEVGSRRAPRRSYGRRRDDDDEYDD